MYNKRISEAIILGAFFCIGLVVFGYLLAGSIVQIKTLIISWGSIRCLQAEDMNSGKAAGIGKHNYANFITLNKICRP